MGHVYIIGMGPGGKDYLIPAAQKAIRAADLLVGHCTQLESYEKTKKRTFSLTHNYKEGCNYIIKKKKKHTIAVLVSGDPGVFSFAKNVRGILKPSEYTIIPGISSVQLMSTRFGLAWEDMRVMSLHAKTKRRLLEIVRRCSKVCILTDQANNPQSIAGYLYRKGIRKRTVYIGENLSYPDERTLTTTLHSLKNTTKEWKRLCIMILTKK